METNNLSIGLLSNERPPVIDPLNNGQGTFHYNHNITEVLVAREEMGNVTITDDPEKATGRMFHYDSLRVEYPRTADNIFGTLITAKYPLNVENKLVNEFQSAKLGIAPKEAAKPYEDFLRDRLAIRKMVDGDCAALNIPTDL